MFRKSDGLKYDARWSCLDEKDNTHDCSFNFDVAKIHCMSMVCQLDVRKNTSAFPAASSLGHNNANGGVM